MFSHAAQTNQPVIFPGDDPLNPQSLKLVWPATPGLRYEVMQSTNLQSWTTAPGYPAAASGPAQQMPFQTTGNAGFFKVNQLDDQPPAIVSQYPQDGGFAVPRFANLTMQLSDATGIDTNSIQLIVGSLGTFTLTNAQLTLSNNILTFINGGSIALGGWSSNIQATLIMADMLGNTGTNTWNFTLEVQPVVVTNLFVFGSPQAQRTGQQVGNIPTAALARRFGPIPMGAGDPWTLDLVESNRLELSYTNTAPGFTVGQYVCNLTPAKADDIFYRRVTAVSDNPGDKRLTLYTTNLSLAEFVEQGSATVSPNSVIYQLGPNSAITRAFSFEHEIVFDSIGVDTNVTLFDEDGVTLTLEEAKFLFTPSLTLSFEIGWFELQRFETTLHGRLETALVPQLTISGDLSDTMEFDLYEHKWLVYVGQLGPVPVWLDLNFSLGAEVGYNLAASATMTTGVRQNVDMSFGVDYVKGRSPEVLGHPTVTSYPMEIVPFTYEINGSASAYATIIPQIDLRVNSLAGVYANVDPRVEINGQATVSNGQLTAADLCLTADANLNVGLSIIGSDDGFELASFNIFEKEWCVTYPPPAQLTILHQPQSRTVAVGDSVTFSVDATALQPISYEWHNNGAQMVGETSSSLTLNNVTLGHGGQYHVQLTSGGQTTNSAVATLTVVSQSLQSGLVAWYPFNGNANDASGNGNNGTTIGPTLTTDRFGNPNSAYQFAGYGQRIEVPRSGSLEPQQLTVAAWVNPSDMQHWQVILGKRYAPTESSYILDTTWNPPPQLWRFCTPLGGALYCTTGPAILTNQWSLVVGTDDRVRRKLYINGVLVADDPSSGSIPYSSMSLYIGSVPYFGEGFCGKIDDVRIYNRALSASEILSLYNSGLPAPAPSSGMALIPAGSFTMGNCMDPNEGSSEELPLHSVYVSAFYMDKYDVTLALWQQVYNWAITHGYSFDYAGSGKAANHPVKTIDWYDSVKWCNARSEMEGRIPAYYTSAIQTTVYRTGQVDVDNSSVKWNAGYRLPTEAEWEKAARGGASGQRFPWGNTISWSQANYYGYPGSLGGYSYDLATAINFDPAFNDGVYYPYTSPVGYFAPNGYGLYDMAGNVWQWCWDLYGDYSGGSQTDPRGPTTGQYGSYRVGRGGGWGNVAINCRTADRCVDPAGLDYGVGFRSVLPPGQ